MTDRDKEKEQNEELERKRGDTMGEQVEQRIEILKRRRVEYDEIDEDDGYHD